MKIADISKIKYAGLVLAATVIASVSLCINVNAATTMKYDPQMTDDELKRAIAASNQVSETLNEGGYYREVRWQGIDEINYMDTVIGPNYYEMKEADWGDNLIYTRLASYGYFCYIPGKKVIRLYDDEMWQYSINHRVTGSYDEEYNPYEKYTERYMNNGMLYTRARITGKGIPMDVLKTDGVDVSRKIDFMEVFREIDPDTLRVRKNIEYVKYADEKELIPYMSSVVEHCTENPRKDAESKLYNDVFGGERHTIKIISKSGTEDEKQYSIAANKDTYLEVWIRNSDRSYTTYVDPGCTIPVVEDEDGLIKFDSDKVLYMK